jgi:hypothetical protein
MRLHIPFYLWHLAWQSACCCQKGVQTGKLGVVWEKGDSPHLCEAPVGPFRKKGTVPFFS